MKLALASTSPRRRALLEAAGIAFSAVDPGLDDAREEALARGWRVLGLAPARVAERLAVAKALASERRVAAGTTCVLAADTVVVLPDDERGDRVLGKPRDAADARAMIERLSGRTHEVVTGIALLDLATGKLDVGSESSRVRFRAVDAAALDRFLASGAWAGKAGAYGVQDDAAAPLVAEVEGSRSNVIGLPVERVQALLATLGKGAKVVALVLAASFLAGCPESKPTPAPTPTPVVSATPGGAKITVKPPVDPNAPPPPAPSAAPAMTPPPQKVPFVPRPSEGLPQSGLPETTLEIAGKKVHVELATTRDQREVGLMWRHEMPDDNGMLFVYPENGKDIHSFWMRNTKIPLSVAFIADDGAIVNIDEMAADTDDTHPSKERVRLVLEMNTLWFKIHGVKPGDVVKGAAEALPLGN